MNDLKNLMDERSSATPGFDHLRLASVQRRVVVRRRRRVLATSLAAVAAVLFGGYLLSPANSTQPSPPAASASPTPSLPGEPEYQYGYRRLAANSAPLSAGLVELTWTPTIWQHRFDFTCTGLVITEGNGPKVEVYINGNLFTSAEGCNLVVISDQSSLESLGVRLGQPSILKVSLPGERPATGAVAATVMENVPFDDYLFPPRPDSLSPLEQLKSCGGSAPEEEIPLLIRSDPADPLKPMNISVTWNGYLHLLGQPTTPGMLSILVDGISATSSTSWTYDASVAQIGTFDTAAKGDIWGPRPAVGSTATITVTPAKMTGPWQVGIIASSQHSFCFVTQGVNAVVQ